MNESIQKYFQLGTIPWMSYPGLDPVDAIRKIAQDDYFDAIEVGPFKDDETRTEAKHLLAQSHLKICYAAQPRIFGGGLNPNDVNEAGRKAAEATLLEAVDEAEYLGAKTVSFVSGKWQPETKELAYQQLMKTTKTVCDYAATKGMGVNIEVFDFDMDKAVLIGPAPLAARFAADMRTICNNFSLLVDLSHFPTTYETSKFAIQTLRPYISHLHIGNAVVKSGYEAFGDMHPRFGFPNSANDTAELVDFLCVLKEEGFFNAEDPYVLSFEVKPRPNEDADIVMASTKRVLKRAWALV